MPSIEEISSWTIQEIIQEVVRLLPARQALVEARNEGWHVATIQETAADAETKILWTDRNADRKLVLLNAFGWLWLRNQKPHHPAWKPRDGGRPMRRPVHSAKVADPADLDPAEIRAVYEKGPKRN